MNNSNHNIFDTYGYSPNSRLVAKQNINSSDKLKIEKLHTIKNCYIVLMDLTDDTEVLKMLDEKITQIEFQLQKLWKFKQDQSYHKFWELPKCICPTDDNIEVYGTGHRYINNNCPIHGKKQ